MHIKIKRQDMTNFR